MSSTDGETRTVGAALERVAERARAFFNREPPSRYLEEWTDRLAQPDESTDHKDLSFVIFRLDQEYFAVRATALVEVTLPQPVHALPHRTNEVVLGLVNIRGQLQLCVSLHGMLGIPVTASPQAIQNHSMSAGFTQLGTSRLVIFREQAELWVCPADEVFGVHRFSRSELGSVPSTFGRSGTFSEAVVLWNGHTTGVLSEEAVFAAFRRSCV